MNESESEGEARDGKCGNQESPVVIDGLEIESIDIPDSCSDKKENEDPRNRPEQGRPEVPHELGTEESAQVAQRIERHEEHPERENDSEGILFERFLEISEFPDSVL